MFGAACMASVQQQPCVGSGVTIFYSVCTLQCRHKQSFWFSKLMSHGSLCDSQFSKSPEPAAVSTYTKLRVNCNLLSRLHITLSTHPGTAMLLCGTHSRLGSVSKCCMGLVGEGWGGGSAGGPLQTATLPEMVPAASVAVGDE